MVLPQQKFREMVIQLLYSADFLTSNEEEMVELMMAELEVSKKNVKAAQERAKQILEKANEIDAFIASVSHSYDVERIHQIIRSILRFGIFELYYDSEIPHKVAIAEAIRLTRKFGTPESAAFVNAVLDQLHQKRATLVSENP